MKISVSILSEINNFENAVRKINETNCDYLHLDIMDSTFTEKSSFTFKQSEKINNLSNKKLDVHIMSTNLDEMIHNYIKLKPEFVTFHLEVENTLQYIKLLKDNNIKVGLAINPDTNIEKIYPYLDMINLVLIMSVVPGKGGQSFITDVTSKIQELCELKSEYNYLIEVDGGINNETIEYIKDYTDIAVSGSYITNSDNYQEKIDSLKNKF